VRRALPAGAESVYVKYRGEVDLKSFNCTDVSRSSFIQRVCYDQRNEYMLISLNGTFYHYCEIGAATVSALMSALQWVVFIMRALRASLTAGFTECRRTEEAKYVLPSPNSCGGVQ
jgi:hypothetical protein